MSVAFDEVIHPSNRLSIMALISKRPWVEFSFVRQSVDISDSALSKQLSTLEDAGYLELKKTGKGVTRKTHVQITEAGQAAFDGHVAALRALVGD